ncbi:MAG: MFS transporter [Phycisphaerales bacterium]|nr:MFS transporter [Phycisphaerales bacterium]
MRSLFSLTVLLFLATLPDAMLAIALKAIAVDRYGVSAGSAHWFMAVNLLGAIAVLPLLARFWRDLPAWKLIAIGAIVDAVCMAITAFPIGWIPTLLIRCVEGGADLVTISTVLGLLGAGTFNRSGSRFGLAGFVMMLGLAVGIGGGGAISDQSAVAVLLTTSGICGLLALMAWLVRSDLDLMQDRAVRVASAAMRSRWRLSLWPAMCFTFGDRAMSAVISVTGALYLTVVLDISMTRAGGFIGVSLLLLAIFSWPAGLIADRLGALRVRIVCAAFYGLCVAAMAYLDSDDGQGLFILMVAIGISGAGLVPTTYALASRSGRGVSDMGSVQAAGTAGYFSGVVIAALLFPELGVHAEQQFQQVFLGFAAGYLVLNMLGVVGLLRWRIGPLR